MNFELQSIVFPEWESWCPCTSTKHVGNLVVIGRINYRKWKNKRAVVELVDR